MSPLLGMRKRLEEMRLIESLHGDTTGAATISRGIRNVVWLRFAIISCTACYRSMKPVSGIAMLARETVTCARSMFPMVAAGLKISAGLTSWMDGVRRQ